MATGVAGAPAALLLLAVLLLLSPLPGRGAGNGTEPRELGRLDERAAAPTPPPVGGITGQLESFNVTTVGDATGATRARLRGWVSDVERDFPERSFVTDQRARGRRRCGEHDGERLPPGPCAR